MGRNSMLKGLDAFGKVCMPSAHHAPLYVLIAPSWADDGGREGQDGLRGCFNAILVLSYRGTHTYRVYRLPPHTPSPFNSKSSVLTTIKNRSKLTHHIKQLVDKSRGEKLVVNMNITFPKVPCYLLSVDIMDISGEHQNDVNHDILKSRLSVEGKLIHEAGRKELQGELERVAKVRGADYCGSCYGGTPPESGCCNTCEEVREAYVRRGWSFTNPDGIEQCVQEGWGDKLKEQATEGCNVAGKVRVNKVIGNFHLSPGRSFQSNAMHVHDLVPYLQGGNKHHFGHVIHRFSFGSEEEQWHENEQQTERLKKSLGIQDPMNGLAAHTEESNYMFQYFLKVVSTKFETLKSSQTLSTHQYSVTSYERDLSTGNAPTKESGHSTSHGFAGVPGVFFSYEISPMLVIHRETRQPFAHFLTSTCAIVGGVLTVAGLIDSMVYAGRNKLASGPANGQHGLAYTREGKWL
ncbi:MAG: hypothetical protein CYPHOPRED_006042 [Cyphobasidiales sp. Tagirdzhanova-0007]|nr:MAG: hypothetical protein CYPHOPRED_006042 [Cyphobasidiales sp. Tagirdzhanova-0007]